jgi:acetyl-CoA carboxylase, biotin carboxylase subunit
LKCRFLADKHGHVLALGERDCSLQRRHQKLIEEAPAPGISRKLRSNLEKASIKLAREINYTGVGTFEYLVDDADDFYFMEANTRIQVEHPITEEVTRIDLVAWQIRVAAGIELPFEQKHIRYHGHAIECRVNAENPNNDFTPSAGVVEDYLAPGGPGVRVDSHLYPGYRVPANYDSLLGKIIVWGETREVAIARMRRALTETVITGVDTTIPFYGMVLSEPEYVAGTLDTGLIAKIVERFTRLEETEHGGLGHARPQ